VAEKLVPAMCVAYVICVLYVLGVYFDRIPAAFALIFEQAFSPTAATGGFLGSTVLMAIRMGVARGIFPTKRAWARPASPRLLVPRATPCFRGW
jgi:AGCS family alanine or glycine:cation symporter